jgi:UDP-glucose 4-epimerase
VNALVIGGQGFIGTEVVRALLSRGVNVTVADRVASPSECEQLFGPSAVRAQRVDILDASAMLTLTIGFDTVYHMAGELGTLELDDDVLTAINVNIIGAVNVFEACVENGVPIVFYPSKPNVWLNTYTITKFASEQFAQLYSAKGNTRICSLRYFNAYGPSQHVGPPRKIIPSFAQRAMRGLPIEVFGSGEQVIDMIYASDLGRITVDFASAARNAIPLDCGRGIGMTANDIAKAVNAHFNNSAGIKHLPVRRGETPDTRCVADIKPLQELLGDLKFASWEASLASTLDWYANQPLIPSGAVA